VRCVVYCRQMSCSPYSQASLSPRFLKFEVVLLKESSSDRGKRKDVRRMIQTGVTCRRGDRHRQGKIRFWSKAKPLNDSDESITKLMWSKGKPQRLVKKQTLSASSVPSFRSKGAETYCICGITTAIERREPANWMCFIDLCGIFCCWRQYICSNVR
jgi:hypothetical protein